MNLSEGSEIHFLSPEGYDYTHIKTSKQNEHGSAIDITRQPFYYSIKEGENISGSSTVTINSTSYILIYQNRRFRLYLVKPYT